MIEGLSLRTWSTWSWLVTGFLVLLLPTAAAQAQDAPLASFDEVKDVVAQFEAGTRPDVISALCQVPSPPEPINCSPSVLFPVGGIIEDSGWEFREICFVVFESGAFALSTRQAGGISDGDGDGDPEFGTINFDIPGIGPDSFYTVDLRNNLAPGLGDPPDTRLRIFNSNVGTYTGGGLAPAAGNLVMTGSLPMPTLGPIGVGASFGTYSAGTTGSLVDTLDTSLPGAPLSGEQVSTDTLFNIDDLSAMPVRDRPLNINRFGITLAAGSGTPGETCTEDTETLDAIGASVDLEKDANVLCSSGNYTVRTTYRITNNGGAPLKGGIPGGIVLEDLVSTTPDVLTTAPDCSVSEGDIVVSPDFGSGSFSAALSASLPVGNFETMDFPSLTVVCTWDRVPADSIPILSMDNDATVLASDANIGREVTDMASASASGNNTGCLGTGMQKEHEGVGFDNLVALERTLPLNGEFQFGSGVDPNGLTDVDAQEDFRAQGAFATPNGVFVTIPANPGGAGILATKGQAARFNWTILVSKPGLDNFGSMDVVCSLCAEQAWPVDRNDMETFSRPGGIWADTLSPALLDRPLTLRVNQICGPLHIEPCEVALDAKSIPGLQTVPLTEDPRSKGVAFMGCKATTIHIDPSNGPPVRMGDLIEIQIDVPETERARLYADPTSCELSYLRMVPDFF